MAKGLKKMLKNPMVLLVIVVIVVLVFSSQKSGFTSDNLNYTPSSEFIVVFFKMEGCVHCKNFQPTWNSVSSQFNNKKVNGKTCKMVTVDSSNRELTNKFDIAGYPTILKLSNNSTFELEERSESGLVDLIES